MSNWDDIHDKSSLLSNFLLKLFDSEKGSLDKLSEDVARKLEDSDYLNSKLQTRDQFDANKAFLQLRSINRKKRFLYYAVRSATAASIIISMTAIGLLFKYIVDTPQIAKINNRISVSRTENNIATLILADGKKVQLGDKQQTIRESNLATIVIDSAGVKYKAINEVTDVEQVVFNSIVVPRGGSYFVILEDGTKVWLNAESKLTYPVSFKGDKREVYLVGEGYFDVAHDESKLFIIGTKGVKLKVLGTAFNICSYPEDNDITTVLVQGSLAVESEYGSVRINPNQAAIYNCSSHNLSVKNVYSKLYTSWIDGEYVFINQTFENISSKLYRWFDVEFVYENSSKKNLRITGSVRKDQKIEDILNIMEIVEDVKFEKIGKRVYVN